MTGISSDGLQFEDQSGGLLGSYGVQDQLIVRLRERSFLFLLRSFEQLLFFQEHRRQS